MKQQTPKYSFKVFWSEADNAYIATCPEFTGLSAFGSTEEKALREAKIALQMFIEDIQESGEELPTPQVPHSYSGKLQFRFAKSLHRAAAELAEAEGVSLNNYIEDALRAKVTGEHIGKRMLEEMRRESAQNRTTLASVIMKGEKESRLTETVKTREISTERTITMSTGGENAKGN
jgi:predicted RNase H-like HicB family nuclease